VLLTVNAPAFAAAGPLRWIVGQQEFWLHFISRLPFVVLWWYCVGRRLDLGLVPASWLRQPRVLALFPAFLGAALAYAGLATLAAAAGWWSEWGQSLWSQQALLLLEYVVPALWWFALAGWLGLAAERIWARSSG